jgi:hypothetical protein
MVLEDAMTETSCGVIRVTGEVLVFALPQVLPGL